MSSFQATPAFPFASPELARSWMDPKLPSLTLAAMIEAQHKNAAALGSANQAAFDGLRTLLQRQGFLMTASVDTCTRVTGDLLAARSFEEGATRQVDAARDAYTSIVARIRELSD
ncbi:MAG: phasin family protein, partial [Geminicoccaceae bacterium]